MVKSHGLVSAMERLEGNGTAMVELTRTNNPVLLSWLVAALADVRIEAVVLDSHTSVLEGSISAIPRRLMVDDPDLARARRILAEAEEIGRSSGP